MSQQGPGPDNMATTWNLSVRKLLSEADRVVENVLLQRREGNGQAMSLPGRNLVPPTAIPQPVAAVETSSALFEDIYDAIKRRDHVLIVGPRGSGKSYAARAGIRLGETRSLDGANPLLVPGAQIVAQGNKEFPRDYFFEPEFEFTEVTSRTGKKLITGLRQPPLFRYARLNAEGRIDLRLKSVDGNVAPDMVARYETSFALKSEGRPEMAIERFVLFLDEINRFNDGVLDSLLLLLEERCAIYQGKLVEVPVVVVATMNPPGYDISARSLSPPLLSRFSAVRSLYTAGFDTLVKTMLPSQLKLPPSELERLNYRAFAAATVAFWGEHDAKRPSGAYLSPQSKQFIDSLAKRGSERFKAALKFISKKSNYGPDARAARDWVLAAQRFLSQQSRAAEGDVGGAAVATLSVAVANKLVLNFSPEAKPDEFQTLMRSLAEVAYEIFTAPDLAKLVANYGRDASRSTGVTPGL
jgi:MoxR-like ATPase